MLSGMVLILCVAVGTPQTHSFAKLVGYQVGFSGTMEECQERGARSVANLDGIFGKASFICRPRTNKDFINMRLPSDDIECSRGRG